MPVIHIPRRTYRQPQGRATLAHEWDDAIAEYPGRSVLHNAGVVAADFGQAWSFNGTSQFVDLGAPPPGPITVGVLVSQGASTNTFPLSSRTTSTNAGIEILSGPGGTADRATARMQIGASGVDTNTTAALVRGRYHLHIATHTSGLFRHFIDGVNVASIFPTGSLTHSQNLYVARRGTTYFAGSVGLAFAIPRWLSSDEVAELSRNPWQLFRSEPRRIYSFPSGPILIPTLSAPSFAGRVPSVSLTY